MKTMMNMKTHKKEKNIDIDIDIDILEYKIII